MPFFYSLANRKEYRFIFQILPEFETRMLSRIVKSGGLYDVVTGLVLNDLLHNALEIIVEIEFFASKKRLHSLRYSHSEIQKKKGPSQSDPLLILPVISVSASSYAFKSQKCGS